MAWKVEEGMANRAPKKDSFPEFRDRIQRLEQERDSRIFCMIHHGQAHICGPTMRDLFSKRDQAGTGKRLEILMHSPGGHPDFAFQVMKFFRRRYEEINIIVPLMAKSAATLMCLGADKIYLGEFADLGPIDTQIDDPSDKQEKAASPLDEFKSLEYMRDMAIEWMTYYASLVNEQYGFSFKQGLEQSIPVVTGLMRPILAQIDPLEVGTYRRALAIAEEYGKRMLALVGESNDDLVHELVWEYPSHGFVIDYEEADRLGLPVERLSPDHDHRFCEAVTELERNYYHGFTSKPQQVPAKNPNTATMPASRKRDATKATPGGDNGHGNGVGEGERPESETNDVKNEGNKAS